MDTDLRREDGFGIVETVVALTLMAIVLMMVLTPTLRGLQTLQSSRLLAVAHNLGQARIEEIRSLDYADVGVVGGNPSGVLASSATTTVQGVAFQIATVVTYEGGFSGNNDVIPQGGDGVEGFWDPGINYKSVVITVAAPVNALKPVRFETIVSPPNLAAHEGFSNVVVRLSKYEEVGSTSATDWPRVSLLRTGSTTATYGNTPAASQPFAALTPSAGVPWVARLGPTLASVGDTTSGWRIRKATIDAGTDRVDAGASTTSFIDLDIYKPVSLELDLHLADGTPVEGGEVSVTSSLGAAIYDGTGSEDDGVGTWLFANHGGEPMPPGTYTVVVDVPGYELVEREIDVPAGYPTSLTHTEDVVLTPQVTVPFAMTVYDRSVTAGQQIAGAIVQLTRVGSTSPVTLTTNANGVASASIGVDSYDVSVSSPNGHASAATSGLAISLTTYSFSQVLGVPAGTGVLDLRNLAGAWRFGYRTTSGGGGYTNVLPNASGRAAVVVTPRRWDVARVCAGGGLKNQLLNQNVVAGAVLLYNPASPASCP